MPAHAFIPPGEIRPLMVAGIEFSDNVHYQGVELLINELIAHSKPFSMMAYPNRSHALSEGTNTRRHLYSLLTRFLHQHLPATVPRPTARRERRPEQDAHERRDPIEATPDADGSVGSDGSAAREAL